MQNRKFINSTMEYCITKKKESKFNLYKIMTFWSFMLGGFISFFFDRCVRKKKKKETQKKRKNFLNDERLRPTNPLIFSSIVRVFCSVVHVGHSTFENYGGTLLSSLMGLLYCKCICGRFAFKDEYILDFLKKITIGNRTSKVAGSVCVFT